ncbi:hypothetical protein Desal_2127 [Maridesulfovibrio salexigens DSM 2638]|uniref:Uncharacterized protein n=1 Tax=Maridesulfovibrio salexigens (strain ATCC 14822 / DSM 2638 / NCIMB 8403 / VKM B-1763) TaxID=526222 RepID=C6BVY4_MARSD|nr:hypothetical protein Desal_2127 [Maridesulfovibrio salexigens DSM 2638]
MVFSACVQKQHSKIDEVREVVFVSTYVECPRPANPILKAVLEEKHIGSSENVDRLMFNIVELKGGLKAMNATINCYEKQAEKKVTK